MKQPEKAARFLHKTIHHGQKCGDTFNISSAYKALSVIEYQSGCLDAAISLVKKGLNLVKKPSGKVIPYSGILYM